MKKHCLQCSKEYKSYPSNKRKYCSRKCQYIARLIVKEKDCPMCHILFRQKRLKQRFCSLRCGYQYKTFSRPMIECRQCKKRFIIKNTSENPHFCCKKCFHQWYRGENRSTWKRETRGLLETRKLTIYQNWRKTVLIKDGYTCQKCGLKLAKLVVHHIQPFKDYPDLRITVSNGQTLCSDCHKKTHDGNYRKNYLFKAG